MATVLREPPPVVAPAQPTLLLKRLTIEQFHRMLDAGILHSGDRTELLGGGVYQKMTQNPPHAACLDLCRGALHGLLSAGWFLREQKPISIVPYSEPEPALVILQGTPRDFTDRHPVPRDIALVIEVADTSILGDRDDKGSLYAGARIPVYWIVNLLDSCIEVYTNPKAGKTPAYRSRQDYGKGNAIPLILAGRTIGSVPVGDLLP